VSAELERIFPALAIDDYVVASPETTAYNCIALAAGESDRWWEPGIYWPIQSGDDLATLISLFASLGYALCDDDRLEAEYQRVPLYADELDNWTHAARQLSDGWWTSKLGEAVDILHRSPRELVGGTYGEVRAIMKRAAGSVSDDAEVG
jgi:hypothetical protein